MNRQQKHAARKGPDHKPVTRKYSKEEKRSNQARWESKHPGEVHPAHLKEISIASNNS